MRPIRPIGPFATRRRRPRGVIAILFGVMLLGLLTMMGLALDLALVYNRKAELQALADATALAAARELNGASGGVGNALTAAASTAASLRYQYNLQNIAWSSAALRFAPSAATPDSAWTDAAGAQSAPAGIWFARVDTRLLDADLGLVGTVFMRFGGTAPASVNTAARATAGRMSTLVTPLAICALSPTAAAARANVATNSAYNELVEYGFRRGVAYDLMNLNPNGTTPENFLIDPLSPPGTPGVAAHFATDVTGPFVCAGAMPMASVLGGAITVRRGFPLATLYKHLNSRFDIYSDNACTAEGAPPDSNIKSYTYNTGVTWMPTAPAQQTAGAWTSGGTRLWTRADPLPGDASNTAPLYGPLWAGAKAVPWSAYNNSPTEPTAGYSAFAASAWTYLYTPGAPAASGYPATQASSTPYSQLSGATFLAPSSEHLPGQARRRVLNVALLDCPVPAGATASATVLGIGRFFMTVPATATSIAAEFAGVTPAASLGGAVELQP